MTTGRTMRRIAVIAAITLSLAIPCPVIGYKVLAIFPFSGKSHFNMLRTVSDELVARGHDVTVVSHFPETSTGQHSTPTNGRGGSRTDFSLAGTVPVFENFTVSQMAGNRYLDEFLLIMEDGVDNCESVLSSGRLTQLIRSGAKFDIVLVEIFNTGCFVSVANQFGAPVIGITSTSLYPWYDGMGGNVVIPSYIPVNLLPFTNQMTFFERLANAVTLVTMKMYYTYKYEPKAQEIVHKYLGKLNSTVSQYVDNVDAVIINSNFAFGNSRPLPPGIIEVGGCTYKTPKPLPEDLERYISSAERGVVYFSMGSIVKGSSLPGSLAMLRAFSRLEGYKVLCKWEDDPPALEFQNIMFVRWTPQFDVLNHPNVKLFISHCGLMGILDALYSSVPIVGIPLFADQFSNMNFIVKNEFGLQLEHDRIDEQIVYETVSAVLGDDKYKKNAQRMSRLYQDRDQHPLDKAVYWIEYVARHRVGLLLKPANLTLYEHYSLDVMVVVVATAYLTAKVLVKCYGTISKTVQRRQY